jgi:hypothetical protein
VSVQEHLAVESRVELVPFVATGEHFYQTTLTAVPPTGEEVEVGVCHAGHSSPTFRQERWCKMLGLS